jgi:uncharacterized protein (TIGR02265 family)
MGEDTVTVKGSPVRSLQKFMERELTAQQREELLRGAPPEFAQRMRGAILPTETIPVHFLNQMCEDAAKMKGESIEAFSRRAGREAAGDAVRGIYRFFALVLTPAALLSKASQMWKALYNRGDLRVINQTDRSATVQLIDFPSEAAGCARVTGWIERMAEMTGAKNVSIEQKQCFANGALHCEWNITWS